MLSISAQSSFAQLSPQDLADLSLEELASVHIISVSRKSESLSDAAASVYVITNSDIHRAGARSLPEALRLAPNLQVAQASASGYAISARGFNSRTANKLLVLIDGRSVYTPLFSGVFWDVQDVVLEDIERIEVISGSGGTLWGTNAVNGIINIITRTSGASQGGLLTLGTGHRESDGAVRYGSTFGENGHYRLYAKSFERKHTSTESGAAKDDAGHKTQLGFRSDWRRSGDQFSVQGNAYRGSEGQAPPGIVLIPGANFALGIISLAGLNLTANWARQLDNGANLSVQACYDRTERTVPPTFAEKLDIVDLQIQHALAVIGSHALIWGAGYRHSMDEVENSRFFAFLPAHLEQKWTNVFAQDEVSLRKNIKLTLGARMERNDYTGNEFLPNARLAWKITPEHLLWTAASRAIRAPSRRDREAFVPGSPPFQLNGGPNFRSETAKVFELGYRGQPAAGISYALTASHTIFDRLSTQEMLLGRNSSVFANKMEGSTTGIETWGTYQARPGWRLSAGFMALRERLRLKPDSNNLSAVLASGLDPAHSWNVRSSFELSPKSELDVIVRAVAALSNPTVAAYRTVDFSYGWKIHPDWEGRISGKNLAGGKHAEFSDPLTRTAFGRSVFINITSRF